MEDASTSSMALPKSKLKIGGSWSGVLEAELEVWTLPILREEVAKRSNSTPDCINLIFSGKVLKDGDGSAKLAELGLKNNSRILATRISADQGKALKAELLAEEERSRRLSRIRAAADALSKRHSDGSLPLENFNIELEDQSGQRVQLGSETDQRGVMMGLMLHEKAKQLIKRQKYEDSLLVLAMGEEAFSLCDPKVIETWFGVISCSATSHGSQWREYALQKARQGIERSYGKDCSRVRLLQAGRHPELSIYLRLELLEGVVAYHSGDFEQSQKSLTSAQAKYLQLQVKDEALSLLMSMGYQERAAKRALRMSNQEVESAVNFLVEEKERIARRDEEDIWRRREITEQKKYGVTPLKKAVDLERLNELVSIGFERLLAAEALRRSENDTQRALDDLTNPEKNAVLQHYIESKKRKRPRQPLEADIEELVSMGFERSRVIAALQASNAKEQALSFLVAGQIPDPLPAINNDLNSLSPTANDTDPSIPLADGMVGGPSAISSTEGRDEEMEDEIAQELTGDPLADYDIEVTKEGEAIAEYLALLTSTATANGSSKTT